MKSKSLKELTRKINAFNKARGWEPLPSDLAKSIVIESSELLEKFQWDETDKSKRKLKPKNKVEIGEEVADVFWYLASFCKSLGINLPKVVEDKLNKNEIKYPKEIFKGKHNEKFYRSQKLKYRVARKNKSKN